MTARRAAYLRLAERAVAGDAKALDFLLSLEGEERSHRSDAEFQPVSARDLELLQGFFDRRRAHTPQQVQPPARQQRCPNLNPKKDNK
jgi:hypothetical protein